MGEQFVKPDTHSLEPLLEHKDKEPPVCSEITCPELSPAPDVVMTGTCSPGKPDMKCTLSCNQGMFVTPAILISECLIGSSRVMSITCQIDGTWSDSIDSFKCDGDVGPPTCPPLPLPNGAKSGRFCAPGRVGRRCEIGCGKGFQMEGKNYMLCTINGQWVGTQPKCLRRELIAIISNVTKQKLLIVN